MAEHRERLQRARNRRQSLRLASTATRRAVSELNPAQRLSLAKSGFTTRPLLVTSPPPSSGRAFGALALGLGTMKRQTAFARTSTGGLSNRRGLLRTARHEVAHQTIDIVDRARSGGSRTLSTSTHHAAIRAAGAESGGQALREVPKLAQESPSRRIQRMQKRLQNQAPRRTGGQGFQPPQLQKVAETGTATQRSRSREQMRRLGRRLRGRIDF